ncbi:glycosyltransferase [Lichenibacterium dinghuense]|uniref:glycosyltransferase n=1 Tax=Lichenibacterium dinghuense TaxID=2895977 RepID=UPI001F1B43F3|nr:glycosyltransferase [Lichenibacterium sp. 6Y81]
MNDVFGMPPSMLHMSWSADWPTDVVPLSLGRDHRPVEPDRLAQPAGSRAHFFFVAPETSAIHPDAVALARPFMAERPDVGIFYADDAVVAPDGTVESVHCKTSFNPALLLADDYMAFPLLIRADILQKVELTFDGDMGEAGWYRFCLDALMAGVVIDRVPHTLLASPAPRPKAPRRARAAAAARWLAQAGQPFRLGEGRFGDTSRLQRAFADYPPVTLVIPTRQSAPIDDVGRAGRPFIANFLDSLKRSTYPLDRVTVLIGDDREDDTIYRGRDDPFAVKRIVTKLAPGEKFNYAVKMNRLWRLAETDSMVLMNDDISVGTPDWIESLLTFSMDPDVGGVGARLLFPDGRIQHAGMFGGIFGVCAHPWYMKRAEEPSYDGWAETHRDCSAVTGAVFATRRGPMDAVNGFDEGFSLDFNDVDLCFRMRMLGYRIVYTPFAEMTHHEKASRRSEVAPGSQVARYMRKWVDVLTDDPMFSPQLLDDTDEVAPRSSASEWVRASRDLFPVTRP